MNEIEHSNKDTVILGYSFKVGDKNNYKEYFESLIEINGYNSIIEYDKNRDSLMGDMNISKVSNGNINENQIESLRWGGYMKSIEEFDNKYFGISPREAKRMDPQQRILLEEVYHCIEDSNIKIEDLYERKVGVYIGGTSSNNNSTYNNIDRFDGTGSSGSVVSGRISYQFGLKGPSMTIDTACSSSLVALYVCERNLKLNEIEYGIVGACNIIWPSITISFSMSGMLSKDGRCKTFDKNANGYVRGESCGVILIKNRNEQYENNKSIYLKSISVNQDGKSNGLTAPNGPCNQRCIE